MTFFLRFFLTLLLLMVAPLATAEESPGTMSLMLDSIDRTTPNPIGSDVARSEGWLSGAWDGTKRIWNEGSQDLYLSGYYWHMPTGFSAERRNRFNNNAWGLGYGRTLTDEQDNQRMLFASSPRTPMKSRCT